MEHIERVSTIINKHSTAVLVGIGLIGAMMPTLIGTRRDPRFLLLTYRVTGDELYYIKYLQATKSNNWLKTHGYPMRRKH
jgi:hypothetical protein